VVAIPSPIPSPVCARLHEAASQLVAGVDPGTYTYSTGPWDAPWEMPRDAAGVLALGARIAAHPTARLGLAALLLLVMLPWVMCLCCALRRLTSSAVPKGDEKGLSASAAELEPVLVSTQEGMYHEGQEGMYHEGQEGMYHEEAAHRRQPIDAVRGLYPVPCTDGVSGLLRRAGLEQYTDECAAQGYDDVDTLIKMHSSDLDTFAAAVRMLPGHKLRFRRMIEASLSGCT